MTQQNPDQFTFKPRARLLLLLGDQLIRDPGIAVFELVKNGYDAYATNVQVIMSSITKPENGTIVIEDNGTGMDLKTVTGIWLEPGTDFRAEQREKAQKKSRVKRLPIGEKGVGRFAAHKLGHHVSVTSRMKGRREVVIDIDWERDFKGKKYLSDAPISVKERSPEHFKGNMTGTRIEITNLRDTWKKEMVQDLARAINSICSPFEIGKDFKVDLLLKSNQDWLDGILKVEDVLDYALYEAHCHLIGKKLTYEYLFKPYPAMQERLAPRQAQLADSKAMNITIEEGKGKAKITRVVDLRKSHVGPVHIDLYIYDRQPRIMNLADADPKGLRTFLDASGGIRVYRDGIRVYDYGEPDNDWLGLESQRINKPGVRLSHNLVIGAVQLSLRKSLDLKSGKGLIEKTNREGFVDNQAYRDFRDAVAVAIRQIETERNFDKNRLRDAYGSARSKEPVLEDLTELRTLIDEKNLTKELGGYLDRIERDYVLIRDRFLTSASAGLSLSVVIHEVEKSIAELVRAVEREKAPVYVKGIAKHLAEVVEGYSGLLRRSASTTEKASEMIGQALFNVSTRLRLHNIKVVQNIRQNDFMAKCSKGLITATLMNLIDNSIWWLDNKFERARNKKRLYLGTTKELHNCPSIIVADNGPGFIDPPEFLTEPFVSRKPNGMGLGLHIAREVMKAHKGQLLFPEPNQIDLPKEFNGAVVALMFEGIAE